MTGPPSSPEPGGAAALRGQDGSQAGCGEDVLRAGEQVWLRALWELVGRNRRQGAWPLRGRVEDALDEEDFRVGEPVQPEPQPQGSWGRGLGGAPRSLSS